MSAMRINLRIASISNEAADSIGRSIDAVLMVRNWYQSPLVIDQFETTLLRTTVS